MNFDPSSACEIICVFLRQHMEKARAKGYVVGVSGGKDSAVTAALLCKAVGKENVLGVLLPNGTQPDIYDSKLVCQHLGVNYKTIDISSAVTALISSLGMSINPHSAINVQPRIRMTMLYAIAHDRGYLVCGTGNLSERYIGYCTKWGDSACDVNPIGNLTTEEVVALGRYLGLPEKILSKAPADGLTGKSDEDNIGFTYKALNTYIRTGQCEDPKVRRKISRMHKHNRHKSVTIPICKI